MAAVDTRRNSWDGGRGGGGVGELFTLITVYFGHCIASGLIVGGVPISQVSFKLPLYHSDRTGFNCAWLCFTLLINTLVYFCLVYKLEKYLQFAINRLSQSKPVLQYLNLVYVQCHVFEMCVHSTSRYCLYVHHWWPAASKDFPAATP